MRTISVLIVLSIALWNPTPARGLDSTGRIHGTVTDRETGKAIVLAYIEVLQTNIWGVTNSDGDFTVEIPPGDHKVRFSRIGYQAVTRDVTVAIGGSTELEIDLVPVVYTMQSITVIAPEREEDREQISNLSLQSDQIQQTPGSFLDIYRAVKTLPGVASNNGMSSEYNVRGGTFDENLVLVDGIEVYRPFHLKAADNASISIFNMDLINRAELVTGGFPARYGDKMSSVLDISYRDGNRDHFSGRLEVSLMHAGALVEGPLSKGSYLLGLRKSYMNYILALLGEDEDNNFDFYDVQGQLTFNVTTADRIRLNFIHSADDYAYQPATFHDSYSRDGVSGETTALEETLSDYRNDLLALSYRRLLNDAALLETIVSHYYEYEKETDLERSNRYRITEGAGGEPDIYEFSNEDETDDMELKIRTSDLKLNLQYSPHRAHEFLAGTRLQHIRYLHHRDWRLSNTWGNDFDDHPDTTFYTHQDTSFYGIERSSYKIAGYVEDNWRITDRFFANAGLRADYFDFNRDLNVAPRLNFSYVSGAGPVLRAAWGVYYQSPTYRELEFDYATSNNTQAQRAVHYVAGFEYPYTAGGTFKLEAYYKDLDRLISFENRNGRLVYSRRNDAVGFARGVDLFLGWNRGRASGWISYGFMHAREDSLGDGVGYIPRATDQRHTLSLVGNLDIRGGITVRLKALYGSGYPYTPSYFVATEDNQWELVYGRRNSARLPSFQRIDLRLNKIFRFHGHDIVTYIEVVNVLNHQNVFAYQWSFNGYEWRLKEENLLPLLPNFGISLRF